MTARPGTVGDNRANRVSAALAVGAVPVRSEYDTRQAWLDHTADTDPDRNPNEAGGHDWSSTALRVCRIVVTRVEGGGCVMANAAFGRIATSTEKRAGVIAFNRFHRAHVDRKPA